MEFDITPIFVLMVGGEYVDAEEGGRFLLIDLFIIRLHFVFPPKEEQE